MNNIIFTAMALFIVCCGSVEAENADQVKYTYVTEAVEMDIDELTFEEAFRLQHNAKGPNRTFWWRGSLYTTDLADVDEFVQYHASQPYEKMGWVLNNDDPDDTCYYNKWDECGVCGGDGKVTWWRDKDGDGLGDAQESIESCYNPNVEDLREATGDFGAIK